MILNCILKLLYIRQPFGILGIRDPGVAQGDIQAPDTARGGVKMINQVEFQYVPTQGL